jgi:transposase
MDIEHFLRKILMAKPYSLDLRKRILKDYDDGTPADDLVQHYEVSRSWLYALIKQRRDIGNITPRHYRPGRKQALAPYEHEVRQLVADHPDAALADFCGMLSKHVSVSTTMEFSQGCRREEVDGVGGGAGVVSSALSSGFESDEEDVFQVEDVGAQVEVT